MNVHENGGGYENVRQPQRIVERIRSRLTLNRRERRWFENAHADMVGGLGAEADPADIMDPSRRRFLTLGAGAGLGIAADRLLVKPVVDSRGGFGALSSFLDEHTGLAEYYDPRRGFDDLTPVAEGGSLMVFDKSDVGSGRTRISYGLLLPKDGNPRAQSDTPAIEVSVTQHKGDPSIRARVIAHFVPEGDTFVLSNREEAIRDSTESPDFPGPGIVYSPFDNGIRLEPLFDLVQDIISEPEIEHSSGWSAARDVSDVRGVETPMFFRETRDGLLLFEATGEIDYDMPPSNDPNLRLLLTV